MTNTAVCEWMYSRFVSGSNDAPGQFAPPTSAGSCSVPSGPSTLLNVGGVKSGPILYRLTTSSASARSAGVKSIRSSTDTPCRSNGSGLVGKGCVGLVRSFGTVDCGTGRSSIGQIGSPVSRFEHEQKRLLGRLRQRADAPAVLVTSNRIGAHGGS